MRIKRAIPESVLTGNVALLAPYVDGLTPTALVAAIRNHDSEPTPDKAPHLLDKHQAAERLGVSHWTIKRWIAAGTLPGRKIGGQWRCSADAVDALTTFRSSEGGQ